MDEERPDIEDGEEQESDAVFRSGFVSLVGRPNVGKSTLLNDLLEAKVSITTPKPQTTRNTIRGVMTVRGRGQIVFVDTPGIHQATKPLNEVMVEMAHRTIADADLNVLIVDATRVIRSDGDIAFGVQRILERLTAVHTPTVLVINKADALSNKAELLPMMEALGAAHPFVEMIPVSALKGDGTGSLVEILLERLPEGPQLYPEDMFTDQAERFIASEIIREQCTMQLKQELPYSVAVEVERFEEVAGKDQIDISAVIHVERESQKGIVIGKKGSRIKAIGTQSRLELERFFGRRVFLETFVRVQPEWSQDAKSLERFGYTVPG